MIDLAKFEQSRTFMAKYEFSVSLDKQSSMFLSLRATGLMKHHLLV